MHYATPCNITQDVTMRQPSTPRPSIPQLLTLPQAATALGVSRDTVHRLCKRGDLPYVQVGFKTAKRISIAALQAWIDAHTVRGAANDR